MKKLRFNIIDILIIVVIAAGLVWFFGFRGDTNAAASGEETFIITYMSPSYPEFVTPFIKTGDSVEDFIKGGGIGTVTDVTVAQGYDVREGADGLMVKSPKEGYEQITIVTEARGRKGENGVIINGNTYLVGMYVTMRAGNGKLYIMLTGIERKGGA